MIALKGSAVTSSSSSAKVSARYSIAFQYIVGACRLEQLARSREQTQVEAPSELLATEHRALVMAAVSQAVAAFESDLTELRVYGAVMPNPAEAVNKLKVIKKDSQQGILARWNLALVALGMHQIGATDPLYEETQLLVDLRNELMHYNSDWDGRTKKDLAQRFATKTFKAPSRLAGSTWPLYLLHADLAAWSCKTALAYLTEIYARLGVESQIDRNRAASVEVEALLATYS